MKAISSGFKKDSVEHSNRPGVLLHPIFPGKVIILREKQVQLKMRYMATSGSSNDTENLTLVGYAPFDEPEVAFAVVVPNTGRVSSQHPINNLIGEKILDTYFDLKKERDEGKDNE